MFWTRALLLSFAVFLAFLLFYSGYDKQSGTLDFSLVARILSFEDADFSVDELKKVFGLSALVVLSLAFLPGPLSYLSPFFAKFLIYRKPVGIWGFIFLLLHALPNLGELIESHTFQDMLGLWLGVFAFLIFLAMALTSHKGAVIRLGYPKWKLLQRTGYIALLLSVFHFVLLELEGGALKVRPFAYLALFLPALTLFLKLYVMLVFGGERTSYEEHFGLVKKTDS